MKDQDFISNGYKEIEPSLYEKFVETCFQKKVVDEKGKKYFITVNKFGPIFDVGPSYEFNVQFTSRNDKPMNINLFSNWSIEEAEYAIERIWKTGLWRHYEEV